MSIMTDTAAASGYYQWYQPPSASQSRVMSSGSPDAKDERLDQARQQTYDLQFLKPGWNGYDALPPSARSVDHAMRWLVSSYAECKDADITWYQPNVTASAEGEVVFEWWAENRSLLIYVEGASVTFHKSLRSDGPTVHEHGDAPLGEGQMELLRWFGE